MDIRSNKPRRVLTIALLAATLVSGTAAACLCTKGTIIVRKFYDANANGIQEANEVRLANWPMTTLLQGSAVKTTSGLISLTHRRAGSVPTTARVR